MSKQIKISAKMARLLFNGCDPDYIATVCHARCRESSTAPTGTMITIHDSELAAIEALGCVVKDGFLQPNPGTRKCPFKTPANLCGIHTSGSKPFGCIASPFTLNGKGTLIVRNRYRLLKCYNDGRRIPAYKAFRSSLDLILGASEAARVCAHLDAGGGDIAATVTDKVYSMLTENDDAKHRTKNGKSPARTFGQDLMRGEHVVGENRLTWVAGRRDRDVLDETSRKILAAGRSAAKRVMPGGGDGTNSMYFHRTADGYRQTKRNTPRRDADKRSNINEAPPLPIRATAAGTENTASGTSIFDPVLCELAYTWFCPPNGMVLDPFAGGSVRGIVAAVLGRKYTGIDLRPEQVQANEAQAAAIVPDNPPTWIVGDSQDAIPEGPFDFVFSCPPYYDLEIYSDDPADLSNMEYSAFLTAYRSIIAQAVARLHDNRFACFVVGDVRDKRGVYRNFPGETIAAFYDAGAVLYNEAILVTAVGSLPIRVGKQFSGGRKLGKTHQNVLVFVKGDPRKATDACGPVEIGNLDEYAVNSAETVQHAT